MKIVEVARPDRGQESFEPPQLGVAYPCPTSSDGHTDPKKNCNGPIFTGDVPTGAFDDVSHVDRG